MNVNVYVCARDCVYHRFDRVCVFVSTASYVSSVWESKAIVYVCLHMYDSMCVCAYVGMCVHLSVCMQECMCVCLCVSIHVYTCVYSCVCI